MSDTLTRDDEPEQYGPEAPIRLFIWRYRCPITGAAQTLDTGARTRFEAFPRALRFLRRQQRRYAKAGVPPRQNIRLPRSPEALTLVMPAGC